MSYSATNGNPLAFSVVSLTAQTFTANDQILAWTASGGPIQLDPTGEFFTLIAGHSYYMEATVRVGSYNSTSDVIGFVWTDTSGGALDVSNSSFMQPFNAIQQASSQTVSMALVRVTTGTLDVHLRSTSFVSSGNIIVFQCAGVVRQLD